MLKYTPVLRLVAKKESSRSARRLLLSVFVKGVGYEVSAPQPARRRQVTSGVRRSAQPNPRQNFSNFTLFQWDFVELEIGRVLKWLQPKKARRGIAKELAPFTYVAQALMGQNQAPAHITLGDICFSRSPYLSGRPGAA
jgi:hypothetical protein